MKILETRAVAPNPRRVRVFLAEKGLTIPFEEINIGAGEHQTPEFLAMNPMGRVPVLVLDDGTCLSETMAICRYFEALHPDPPLFGQGALGQAVVEMWNRRMEFGLFSAVAQVFRHLHPRLAAMEKPQVREWGEANRPKARAALQMLDARLGESPFVAGPDFTVADITALAAIGLMKFARLDRPEELLNLARWWADVSARPSFGA